MLSATRVELFLSSVLDGSELPHHLVDPIVGTHSEEHNFVALEETEDDPIRSIDSKTPHLLILRLKLLGVK